MEEEKNFYIVEANALPEVFLKVIEVKRLLETGKMQTVQDATKKVDISRSAFYKYRDSIFPFYENFRGRTITIAFALDNEAGILSNLLNLFASEEANILTINQNIPINNVANVTITIETGQMKKSLTELLDKMQALEGVQNYKIIARE